MKTLKYTIIKDANQYKVYCDTLANLTAEKRKGAQDEIDLLTLLIEKWDNEQPFFKDNDPIQLLNALMHKHNLKQKDLCRILGLSQGIISRILNHRTGLSKESIRILAIYFNLSQEAFNRPYSLRNDARLVKNEKNTEGA